MVWPALMRCARAISGGRECFLRDVIFGWALVPGPLVGIAFGVLTPAVFQWPILCFWGGVLGLFVGPVVAAIEGVLVAGFVRIGCRLVTGSRFV